MKTLKKNARFIAAFAVALILVSALVVGCPNSSSPSGSKGGFTVIAPPDNPQGAGPGATPGNPQGGDPGVIPEGMGSVRLGLVIDNSGRTILPGTIQLSNFTSFDLVFTNKVGGATTTETINGTTFADIDLIPGDYTLTVTGNTAIGAAATASSANGDITSDNDITVGGTDGFTIDTEETTTLTVTLKLLDPLSTGNGRLTWNVNLSGVTGVQSAAMTPLIWDNGSVGNSQTPQNLVTTPASFASYPSGYFWLDFYVQTNSGGTINRRYIAHIYRGVNTSAPNLVFTDDDIYNENPPPGQGGGTINFTTFTPPDFPAVFRATANASIGTNGLGTGDDGSDTYPFRLSLTGVGVTNRIVFNIDNDTDFVTNSIIWDGGGDITRRLGTGTSTITLTAGDDGFKVPASIISITVSGTVSGKPYSTMFFVRIVA
jgi:hypothetical protein